jgi:ATP-dependent exoDNAse (exonuclease V) beta subunit
MITHLKAVNNAGPTEIAAYTGVEQKKVILWKIAEIVSDPNYKIKEEEGQYRTIEYGDIAVLSRTRNFGLELYSLAEEHGIPVAYEGGVELFRTVPALMLIAWLRIMNDKDSKKGWAVILEDTGYTLDEAKYILDTKEYPEDMLEFRSCLKELDTIGGIACTIFEKYGIDGVFADRVIEVLQNTFNNTDMNMGDLINFIEDNIKAGETYEVDSGQGENAFMVQTIHSAKGLEYPVIILPDLGTRRGGFRRAIEYREPLGLRQSKIYAEETFPYNYDNWKNYMMYKCLSGDYDEERRLLYVAMTRAKNYLFLTANRDGPSEFFNNLTIDPEEIEPFIEPISQTMPEREVLMVEGAEIPGTVKLSCHSLFNESNINFEGEGRGLEYGLKVHQFAENYVMGEDVKPANLDEKNVKEFIDSLNGELICEQECLLPLDLDDRRIFFEGRIDLLHLHEDKVEIIDFKTDRSRSAEREYVKQLSLYYHVLDGIYSGKIVTPYIFYTESGEMFRVQPLSIENIKETIRYVLSSYLYSPEQSWCT